MRWAAAAELAMMCDIVIAADQREIRPARRSSSAPSPAPAATQRLTRAVGKSKAMEMILTGRMMDAEEAERSGLASRVVPVADVVDEAVAVARTDCALLGAHRGARQGEREPGPSRPRSRKALLYERAVFYASFATEDQKERDGRLYREARARLQQPLGPLTGAGPRGIRPPDHKRDLPMAHSRQARKRVRQNKRRVAVNRARISPHPHLHPPGGGKPSRVATSARRKRPCARPSPRSCAARRRQCCIGAPQRAGSRCSHAAWARSPTARPDRAARAAVLIFALGGTARPSIGSAVPTPRKHAVRIPVMPPTDWLSAFTLIANIATEM